MAVAFRKFFLSATAPFYNIAAERVHIALRRGFPKPSFIVLFAPNIERKCVLHGKKTAKTVAFLSHRTYNIVYI